MFRLSLFKCTLLLFDAGFNSKNQITANKRQKRPSGQDSVYRGRERQGTTKPRVCWQQQWIKGRLWWGYNHEYVEAYSL